MTAAPHLISTLVKLPAVTAAPVEDLKHETESKRKGQGNASQHEKN